MLLQLISLVRRSRIFCSRATSQHWVDRRLASVLSVIVISFGWVSAHAQFGPGCSPPSVPNFANGNQIALNAAIPGGVNFGFASRPAGCTPYNGVRVKAATTLPPGIAATLNAGATSVGFSGTPTALATYIGIIEVTPDNGITWADALRIVFDVASCMHWNGAANQRFRVTLPAISVGGKDHVALPRPSAGVAYSTTSSVLVIPPNQYAPNLYCTPANFQLSNFGGGSMNGTSGPNAPLGFTVSGTPTSNPSANSGGCLTDPDASSDASISLRNAANEPIGSLPVCFTENNNPGSLTIGAVLPVGAVGVPYSGTFTSNAITAPTFAIIDGSLPQGLSLNPATGAVTGIPTTAEVRLFVARVTASDTLNASSEFSIAINAAPTQPANTATVPTAPHVALVLLTVLVAATGVGVMRTRK